MRHLWSVIARTLRGICSLYYRYGMVGLVVLALGAAGLEAAQDERALRFIIVDDRQTAQDILQQLQRGASFSAMAHAKSVGPEASQWGYGGILRLNEVQPTMRAALLKLQEGQVSDVLELGNQFVIVKVISPKIAQHFGAADRAEDEGKRSQAIQELQAALRLEADNVQAYIRLALLQQSTKQFDEAIRTLEKAQQYAPQDAQVTLFVASTYMHAAVEGKQKAQAEKALQAFQRVLQLDERYAPSVHFGMGKLYLLALQQADTALGHLEKATEVPTSVAEVHRLLIQAYYDTRRYEQAWQSLRRAQALGFDFPELLAALQKVKQSSQR